MTFTALSLALVSASFLGANAIAIQPQTDSFHPPQLRSEVEGELTEVFVLATSHLSQVDSFSAEGLSLILDRLEAFAPSAIAIETLSGQTVFVMSSYGDLYKDSGGVLRTSLRAAELGGAELDLTLPQAGSRIIIEAPDWEATDDPRIRRQRAALFAAAGEPWSALLQWLYLAQADRVAGDGVSTELADFLNDLETSNNENRTLGVELALRLGHERVFAADDHTASHLTARIVEPLMATWNAPENADLQQHPYITGEVYNQSAVNWFDPDAVLAFYREQNSQAFGSVDVEAQWKIMLDRPFIEDAGRIRFAEWQARNLRMAAHIVEAAGTVPGERILMITGASHKVWLDAYLNQMSDVQVVSSSDILN